MTHERYPDGPNQSDVMLVTYLLGSPELHRRIAPVWQASWRVLCFHRQPVATNSQTCPPPYTNEGSAEKFTVYATPNFTLCLDPAPGLLPKGVRRPGAYQYLSDLGAELGCLSYSSSLSKCQCLIDDPVGSRFRSCYLMAGCLSLLSAPLLVAPTMSRLDSELVSS
jgi:hypothetical protein